MQHATANQVATEQSPRAGLIHPSIQRWVLTLFDQGLVSGMRFLTTIVVGRAAGPDELGHYSLAFSVLVLIGCFQEAIITTPYAIHFHRLRKRSRAAYSGASLLLHAFVAISGGLLLLATAGVSAIGWPHSAWTKMAVVVACTIPFSLMWEFSRRSLLAQLDIAGATRVDVITSVVQLAGLSYFAAMGQLTATTALASIALGAATAAIFWLYASRNSRATSWQKLPLYWGRNWALGKWLVAGQMMGSFHGMVPTLLLTMLSTAAATGVFAAYFNIALIANPLILAVGNYLTSRTAQAFKQEGVGAVARLIRNAVIVTSVTLALFMATLAICGERVVSLVYGPEYVGHGLMLVLLGACPMTWGISVTCACGLAALRYPRGGFIASLIGTSVSVVAISALIPFWSATGAAAGLLLGGSVATALHVTAFVGRCRSLMSDHRLARADAFQVSSQQTFVTRGSTQECCL